MSNAETKIVQIDGWHEGKLYRGGVVVKDHIETQEEYFQNIDSFVGERLQKHHERIFATILAPSTDRLREIKVHLQDGRQLQRGSDGFEVPTYVLPMSPDEAKSIVNELLAQRSGNAQ